MTQAQPRTRCPPQAGVIWSTNPSSTPLGAVSGYSGTFGGGFACIHRNPKAHRRQASSTPKAESRKDAACVTVAYTCLCVRVCGEGGGGYIQDPRPVGSAGTREGVDDDGAMLADAINQVARQGHAINAMVGRPANGVHRELARAISNRRPDEAVLRGRRPAPRGGKDLYHQRRLSGFTRPSRELDLRRDGRRGRSRWGRLSDKLSDSLSGVDVQTTASDGKG